MRGEQSDAGEGGAACTTLTLGASRLDLSREERERCTTVSVPISVTVI